MKPTYHRKSYFFQTHFFQLKIKQRERENHVLEKDKYTHMCSKTHHDEAQTHR